MVPPRHTEPDGADEPRLTAAERVEIRHVLQAPRLTQEQYDEIIEILRNEQFKSMFWSTVRLWVGWGAASLTAVYGAYEALKKLKG
jgi:hypothetical protein